MSKKIDNSYVGDQGGVPDLTTGKTRTNPSAYHPENVVQLKGITKEGGCSYAAAFTYALSGNTFTFTPTAGHTNSALRFWRFRIIDSDGNEAVGQSLVASFATITVNVSGLNPLAEWDIEFSAEVTTSCGKCGVDWLTRLPAGYALNFPAI